ncbi:MAG: glutamate formimidoyltransferase [Candidatus Lambdaproteobacteria bacterium RIFOXYD2_FULL_50_16]|uniref:glutamate formimidoyltransferase n=1 Tax=Candidatus Lambdaproteobacteria bacterium RIFOXYD2_FULL_50_16 TaxID=1817772 RepID=A0A1F6GGB4_9PROT|nr:MAG: glutamate formimidoyltransferase [Candidatus Lambdaproteobacteria bacterium RIFOXYD2_FULL_50_16]
MQLIEAVPNFSEGRDNQTIQLIAQALASVPKVTLLHLDAGMDANRTVYTLIGPPDLVLDALLKASKIAFERIDMRQHQGNHPRIGALDVCPLIPLSKITLDETIRLSQQLGKSLAETHQLPVYLYAQSASSPKRKDLASIRKGGYEALGDKLSLPEWAPDFGPILPNPRLGASVVGVRPILIAFNLNLNSCNLEQAQTLAKALRTRRNTDPQLASVRFFGWVAPQLGRAQLSTNLLDYHQCSIAQVFARVSEVAQNMGMQVTGSELVGLCPLEALIDQTQTLSDLPAAISALGLDELGHFDEDSKVIELNLLKKGKIHEVQSLSWRFPNQ